MMSRKALYLVSAVLLLTSISAYGATPPAPPPAKKITLKFVDQWKPDQYNVVKGMELFNEIGRRSKGRLEIIRAGGPEVIPAADQLTYCGKGAVDLVIGSASYYKGIVPEAQILGLPVVPWSFDNVSKLTASIADDLDKIYQKKTNTKSLFLDFGSCNIFIFTKSKVVNSVDGMKGLKIRSPGGLESLLLEALGSAATRIASSEIYTSAERGIIDGASRPAQAVLDWREYEIWKHMLSTPLCFMMTGTLLANVDSFNKLPNDLQKLMLDTIKEQREDTMKYFQNVETKAINQMTGKGTKVVDLKQGDAAKWHGIAAPVAEKYFLKECPDNGKMLLDKLKAAAK